MFFVISTTSAAHHVAVHSDRGSGYESAGALQRPALLEALGNAGVVTGGLAGEVNVYDHFMNFTLLRTSAVLGGSPVRIFPSLLGTSMFLAWGSFVGDLAVLDENSLCVNRVVRAHVGGILAFRIYVRSAVQSLLISSGADGNVKVWASLSSEPRLKPTIVRVVPHTFVVTVGTDDGSVQVWDDLRGQWAAYAGRHSRPVSGMEFMEDRRTMITSGLTDLKIWDVLDRSCLMSWTAAATRISSILRYQGDIVVVDSDTIRLWDVSRQRLRGRFAFGFDGAVSCACIDDDVIIIGSSEGKSL
ncbi:hypothetical protein FOZ61_001403 [Perkinsus olseni]|uniref:Guanine nucleotide-binding protein subunit beta-like protein n=1 Tax=Perkinsus olseni TaxID=32597 RepID=A0A7J6KQF1_PEROL|nr:hypothetical protein FOZ61_001403 [Perkinsus olseni]